MGRLSLKKNIYIGFALMVGAVLTSGFVSYVGFGRLRETAERKQRIDDANATVLRIDRDVQELRLRVGRYVTSGLPSLREEAQAIHRRLHERVQQMKAQDLGPRTNELFSYIGLHIDEYERQFAAVVAERRVRESLVEDRLPELAEDVRKAFDGLANSVEADAPSNLERLAMAECRSQFSQAEKSLLRYFATPSTRRVNAAVRSIDEAIATAQPMAERDGHSDTVRAIREYEVTGLRAVQATRSYLFLLNVVMAGEASEVAHYAAKLRSVAAEKSREIAEEVAATGRRVNRILAGTVGAAALLATLMAWRLAALIIPPLSAITASFGTLSRGETLDDIPGTTRHDEIGELAQAARVFSDRNRQTQQLLTQSESLRSELQQQAETLAASNRELDSFAYIASHDLKSPLRGIRQLASWIVEDVGDRLPDDSREHLNLMRSRIGKMENLLDGLLAYSRVGKRASEPETVDARELLTDVVELTDNPHGIVIKVPDDLPTFATQHAPLKQVLLNLIGNAIKYNHREGEGLIEVEWEDRANDYRVSVIDNGPGIDPMHRERVFQMYQRVGDVTVDGTGMGLALIKKQIEHLGGSIHVESALGEGARFVFTWPKQATEEQPQQQERYAETASD